MTAPRRIPEGFVPYKETPVFDARTLPAGLRRAHTTKAGVWAEIRVLQGRLRYTVPAWSRDAVIAAGDVGIVAPQVPHAVEPLGDVRVQVVFFRRGVPEAQP